MPAKCVVFVVLRILDVSRSTHSCMCCMFTVNEITVVLCILFSAERSRPVRGID